MNTRWSGLIWAIFGLAVASSPALAQLGCTQWSFLNPAVKPAPRYAHMMAYDSARGVTVLFGGNVAGGISVPPTYVNDTWEWNGSTWTQRNIPNPPPVRGTGMMVYDSARRVCVLFGGQNTTGRLGDTWEYDGLQWVQRFSPVHPARRLSHFMAFDSRRNVTVLFGGWGGEPPVSAILGDTWEWDGTRWTQRFPLVSPLPRVSGGSAFDSIRGKTVIFAGGGDFRATAETWEYDGDIWALRFANVSFWRITPAMCFDSARGKCFAFGGILGNIRYADEFEWNGTSWWHDDIPGAGNRSDSVVVYDSARRRVVLFGGESPAPARLNDTWELINLNPIIVSASPVSQTVELGAAVTMTANASGNNLSYQWRRNGVPILGAATATLQIGPVQISDRGVYDCLISNPCGSTVTGPATLSLAAGSCPADLNGDGQLDPDDLGDFINIFFADPPSQNADFNGDGITNPDDLGDFLNLYFRGC